MAALRPLDGDVPWARRSEEPADIYVWFTLFLELGPGRTLPRLDAEMGGGQGAKIRAASLAWAVVRTTTSVAR